MGKDAEGMGSVENSLFVALNQVDLLAVNSFPSSNYPSISFYYSLRASSPIWASEASLARTRERSNRRVCSQASFTIETIFNLILAF